MLVPHALSELGPVMLADVFSPPLLYARSRQEVNVFFVQLRAGLRVFWRDVCWRHVTKTTKTLRAPAHAPCPVTVQPATQHGLARLQLLQGPEISTDECQALHERCV